MNIRLLYLCRNLKQRALKGALLEIKYLTSFMTCITYGKNNCNLQDALLIAAAIYSGPTDFIHTKKESQGLSSPGLPYEKRRLPTLPHCIAVPSAQVGLTSLFGMGRGGAPPQ